MASHKLGDQPNLMAEIADLPATIVATGACFHRDSTARLLCEKSKQLITPKFLAQKHAVSSVRALSPALRPILEPNTNSAAIFCYKLYACVFQYALNTFQRTRPQILTSLEASDSLCRDVCCLCKIEYSPIKCDACQLTLNSLHITMPW
jgi:hypothetical protein